VELGVNARLKHLFLDFKNNIYVKLNIDRPILYQLSYNVWCLASGSMKLMRIFAGVPIERKHQTTVGSRVNPRAAVACVLAVYSLSA